jgi:hypothetical protein
MTETGIRELGSWEPLPTGPALVDYWRGRLGKAERLILEMLTHPGISRPADQRGSGGQGRVRSERWRLQQRLGTAEDT